MYDRAVWAFLVNTCMYVHIAREKYLCVEGDSRWYGSLFGCLLFGLLQGDSCPFTCATQKKILEGKEYSDLEFSGHSNNYWT